MKRVSVRNKQVSALGLVIDSGSGLLGFKFYFVSEDIAIVGCSNSPFIFCSAVKSLVNASILSVHATSVHVLYSTYTIQCCGPPAHTINCQLIVTL